jgi:hypothetical protein
MGLQGQAVKEAVKKWSGSGSRGEGVASLDMLPFPICKCSFNPFVDGERRYGCFHHHQLRQDCISKCGLKKGWESFEQFKNPSSSPTKKPRSRRPHPRRRQKIKENPGSSPTKKPRSKRPHPRRRQKIKEEDDDGDNLEEEEHLSSFNLLTAIRATAAKKLASLSSIFERNERLKSGKQKPA